MRVFEMYTSRNGRYLAACAFERNVQIWDMQTREQIGEYLTRFLAAGRRLTIADSGTYFAAAAYGRYGITLYETAAGQAVWNTKEIKRIQRIQFSADETQIYVINNDEKLYTLSAADGSILSVQKNIAGIYESRYGKMLFTSKMQLQYAEGSMAFERQPYTLCRTKDAILCTSYEGSLRCFSMDGTLLWKRFPEEKTTYRELFYCEEKDCLTAVCWRMSTDKSFMAEILHMDGTLSHTIELGMGHCFVSANGGTEIVSCDGTIFSLDGTKMGILDFGQEE